MSARRDNSGMPEPRCLDHGRRTPCAGAVENRLPLTESGRSFPRCDRHWADRLDEQERIDRTYPTNAPADFDPSYAGERWDEED